jgi:hypothetical protein
VALISFTERLIVGAGSLLCLGDARQSTGEIQPSQQPAQGKRLGGAKRMPNGVPTNWNPDLPDNSSLSDLQTALSSGTNWLASVDQDTWQYTTWTQDLYNWWIGGLWSSPDTAQDRSYSKGTAVHVRFYTYTDVPEHETRTLIVSRTFVVKNCIATLTHVEQDQRKATRTWVRWSLTALFQDNVKGSETDAVTSAVMSGLGIVTEGVANAVLSVAGAIASLIPLFRKAYAISVSRASAPGGEVWIDEGPPSSAVEASFTLPPEVCETLGAAWQKPVTMPVSEVK